MRLGGSVNQNSELTGVSATAVTKAEIVAVHSTKCKFVIGTDTSTSNLQQ